LRVNGDDFEVLACAQDGIRGKDIGAHVNEEFLRAWRLRETAGKGRGDKLGDGARNRNEGWEARGAGVDLEGFHETRPGGPADGIDDGDELTGGFDGDEGWAIGIRRGERRVRDFLIGARVGIGDLEHVNAVDAGTEKEAALYVDGEELAGGRERGAVGGSEQAGLVIAEENSTAGRKDERLGKLGLCQIGTEKIETGEGEEFEEKRLRANSPARRGARQERRSKLHGHGASFSARTAA